MVTVTRVRVEMGSPDDVEDFLRAYAVDAVDRLDESDACERFSFVVTGDPEDPFDRRYVGLLFEGDVEEVVAGERERIERLAGDGLVADWERMETRERDPEEEPLTGAERDLAARLNDLETRIAALLLDEFDELPAPVDTYPEASDVPVGFWGVPHTVMHQVGYDLEDELDVYVAGIEHTLRNYAEHDSQARAEAVLDDLIERLDGNRETVRDGRLDS